MNAPTSSNVSHCVASSTQHKQRDFEALHKLHTFSTNTSVLNKIIKDLYIQGFKILCVAQEKTWEDDDVRVWRLSPMASYAEIEAS